MWMNIIQLKMLVLLWEKCCLKALGDKKGIQRYGFYVPMDESIALCVIDLGGRFHLNFKAKFKRNNVGEFPTELD